MAAAVNTASRPAENSGGGRRGSMSWPGSQCAGSALVRARATHCNFGSLAGRNVTCSTRTPIPPSARPASARAARSPFAGGWLRDFFSVERGGKPSAGGCGKSPASEDAGGPLSPLLVVRRGGWPSPVHARPASQPALPIQATPDALEPRPSPPATTPRQALEPGLAPLCAAGRVSYTSNRPTTNPLLRGFPVAPTARPWRPRLDVRFPAALCDDVL